MHSEPGPPSEEMSVSMLEALFSRSPVGLHLLDTDLRIVRVNTATPALRGLTSKDVVGRRLQDVYDVVGDDVAALVRDVLDTGVPLRGRVLRARVRNSPVEVRHVEVTALRLDNPRGEALGLAVTGIDVTERERGRCRGRVLDTVRRTVGRSLDAAVTGEELVEAVVPAFADIAVVEVVDAVLRGDEPPLAPLPGDTPLMRTAFRSRHDRPPAAHPVGDVRRLPGPTPFTRALADLRPRVVRLAPDAPWYDVDAPRADAIRSTRAHTLLAAPLTLRGTVLGLLSLYRTGDTPPFDEGDRRLAVELAAHTALCVDNARRFTREHTVAATVQRQLLPREPESHTSLETAYLSLTGVDPGSWYDTIALSGARTALVVGSVAGRGLNAATTMGQLRTVIRSLSAFDLPPDELLARLHDTTAELAHERACRPYGGPLRREMLCADCVYAIHDPLSGSCVMACAGRLSPLVVRPDRTVGVPDAPSGPRLGTVGDTPFGSVAFEVPSGSVLVFTSDPRLTAHLAEHPGPLRMAPEFHDRSLQDLCDAVVYALPPGLAAGDAAMIVARVHSFPADRCATWQLPSEADAVAEARRRAHDRLVAWKVDEETAFNTELIVSELVTNAIRHGTPPVQLRLINDRTLTCEVLDGSAAAPRLRHARTADEGGRGLFIAAQLARAWGTRYSPEGKTIWTEQTLPEDGDDGRVSI
ncbi:SpoIIE family protein phosphatase [Streptomyces sp. NPDC026666]|uniref:SpoIIE family protein phosphatase n=1 Tax=Streptomyces sp. NPDC026666 TaxID=3154799 RepID=UPI0034512F00